MQESQLIVGAAFPDGDKSGATVNNTVASTCLSTQVTAMSYPVSFSSLAAFEKMTGGECPG